MTADIRTAAQRKAKRLRVTSNGREYGMAKLYKDAFVDGAVWGAARVTPTREQIAAEMKRHHFNDNRLDNQTWGMWMAECDCGWWSPEFHYPGESTDAYYAHAAENVAALMAGLAEGESSEQAN